MTAKGNGAMADTVYRDPLQPLAARVDDLLARLTPAERLGLLHQYQPAIPRLGIAAFKTGTEALHGLAWLGEATVYPQAIGLATSWNPSLLTEVGAAVADEVASKADRNVWAPVVNPLRDPRWGRNEEGYSEDPWLTGVLATAYARGLAYRTAPTLKHFLAYNNETDRDTTSSELTPRVLHEYDLPPFRIPIEAGAASAVMASYNLVNGRPAHLSPLINEELRRWTDEEVLVVGDAGAVSNIAGSQRYLPDHVAGFAAALLAGVDSFTENDTDPGPTLERLGAALHRGVLEPADIDRAARRVLTMRMRLGEFDVAQKPHDPPNSHAPHGSPAPRRSAQAAPDEVARQAIVLLRNDAGHLPFDQTVTTLAVLGPLADTVATDWYSGTLPYRVSARAGLAARVATLYHDGTDRIALSSGGGGYGEYDVFDWGQGVVALRSTTTGKFLSGDDVLTADSDGPGGWVVHETFRFVDRPDGTVALRHLASGHYVRPADKGLRADAAEPHGFTVTLLDDGVQAAAALARTADAAVVVVGNHPMVNGRETEDRVDLALPAMHDALIRAVLAANPRTVLVISSSYPYAIEPAGPYPPTVLWSAHGGQEYGAALADVLFGATDPGGRLTQTWYRSAAELPDLLDYDVIGSDTTYLYYRGEPLFPFGHGLSYASFAYGPLTVGEDLVATVEVTNTGTRPGDEVVQLYTRQRRSAVKRPLRQLRAFKKVHLEPGASTTVHLPIAVRDLGYWDATLGRFVVETAHHTVMVGRSCTDIRRTATVAVQGFVVDGAPAVAVGAR
jgi:beta-glucosidase